MSNKIIYDFKKILNEAENTNDTENERALKLNFKALNKNFEITSNLRQLNLLYAAAIKIIADADGNEIDFDNSKGEGGFSFLHYAVWANATGLVKTFLQHESIDVNAQSDAGLTALQLAIIQNSPKILKILLSHPEIDLNLACVDGWTALHLAVSYGYEELIAEILKFKSKLQIEARMRHQITPLQLAALLDKGNLLKILLENDANAQLTTATGETALKLAEKFKCENAVEILRQAEAKIGLEHSTTKANISQIAPVTSQTNTLALEKRPTLNESEATQSSTPIVSKPSPIIYDFSNDRFNDAATLQFFRATFEGKVGEMKSLLAKGNIDLGAVHKSGKNIWDFGILNGDPAVVECLLQAKNQKADLTDLLFKAAKMGSQSIVEYLIEVKDVNPHFNYAKNETLLSAAIASANLELVLYLLEVHCPPIVSTADNCPLCDAFAFKNLELIECLLEAGGLRIEGVSNGKRPILHAAEKSNLEIFKYLLEKGADINVKHEGKGVFDYAAISGNWDIMLYLVKEKDFKFDANISGTNLSICFQFVRVASLEDIKYLIEVEKLSFKKKKGPRNGTILHEAALNKNVEVIKYFVEEHGLNVTARDDDGYVPLFYSVESNNLAAVKYFLEELNLSGHFKDVKNRTALHIAAMKGHLEIVRYLVEEKKVNVNAKDNNNATPLLLSFKSPEKATAKSGHVEVMKYLWQIVNGSLNLDKLVEYIWAEKHGEDSAVDKKKLLFNAAQDGNLTLIKFLIEEFGMDANMKGEKNRTALHIAAMNGHLKIVRYLVEEKKSDVNAKDNDDATPLLLSFKCPEKATANSGHVEVMKYLWKTVNGSLNLDQLVEYIWAEKHGKNSAVDKKQLLFDAAYDGNLTLIKFLIEDVGLDVNKKNGDGYTPIFWAVLYNKLEAVKYFVKCAKVDLYVREDNNRTVRTCARDWHRDVIASYLATMGAPL